MASFLVVDAEEAVVVVAVEARIAVGRALVNVVVEPPLVTSVASATVELVEADMV